MKGKRAKRGKGLTRRQFIRQGAMAAVAAAAATGLPKLVKPVWAAAPEAILLGRPNPSTGPIAAFGESSPWVDDRAVAEINRDGGIFIKEAGKKIPVQYKLVDTESDPTKAAEVASRLILHDKVDLMLAFHTPATVNPVTSVCERFGVPAVATDDPIEMWLTGGPYRWSFLTFFLVGDQMVPALMGMWKQLKTNMKVGLFLPNDTDGIEIGKVAAAMLPAQGFTLVDVGRFQGGTNDFSSTINTWKNEQIDIIFGNATPPDWATCWRQCAREGFKPKIATVTRATLFPTAVEAIGGELPDGLTSEIWWSPNHPFKSSIAGYSAREFAEAYMKDNNKQWTQPIGFKYAGFEIAADVLRRAQSLDKETLRQALADTDLDTMVGHVKFNEQNFATTPVVGGQWVKGDKYPWDLKIRFDNGNAYIPTDGTLTPIP